jgi:hypothetical protein
MMSNTAEPIKTSLTSQSNAVESTQNRIKGAEFFKDSNPATRRVASYLPMEGEDRINAYLALEMKNDSSPFAKIRHTNIEILEKFLLCVARGEQDKAERLLKIAQKPGGTPPSTWLLGVSTFTDYSGRIFNCTAYEYAYWAKDIHMCQMLERYIDEETKAEILKRITAMERIDETTGKPIGLVYQQHGQTYRSAHFELTELKQALREYIDCFHGEENARDANARNRAWLNVGLAQRDVPAHVAHEYCRLDRSFNPMPQFYETTLPRVLYKSTTGDITWFPLMDSNSGLGFDYAFIRNRSRSPLGIKRYPWGSKSALADWTAITCLDVVRTAQLKQLRENLLSSTTAVSAIHGSSHL